MTIGIITAMKIEFDELRVKLADRALVDSPFFETIKGQLGDCSVVLIQAGVGKVCTTMATQWLIDKFALNLIMNVGIAGSLTNNASVGSIVIGSKFVQHDFMPAPWLSRPQGEVSFMGERSYPISDEKINRMIMDITHGYSQPLKIQLGTIISGDEPIFSDDRKEALLREFAKFTPLAADMESAAFAFTASENKLPFVVIRSIADRATKKDEPTEPGGNARQNGTATLAAQIATEFIRSMPETVDGNLIK